MVSLTEFTQAPQIKTPMQAQAKTEGIPFSVRVGFSGTPAPELQWFVCIIKKYIFDLNKVKVFSKKEIETLLIVFGCQISRQRD